MRTTTVLLVLLLSACVDLDGDEARALDPRLASSSAAVVNGQPTAEFPAVGKVLIADGQGGVGDGMCTATLIGCQTVLTAAHCVCPAGVFADTCVPEPRAVFFPNFGTEQVARIAVHPQYASSAEGLNEHDVAILHLAQPVTGIAPMALQATKPGPQPATVIGYGVTVFGGTDFGIKRIGSTALQTCEAPEDDLQHLCIPQSPAGLCSGDSGGPLILGQGDQATVAGVASYVKAPACADLTVDSSVFANLDFIRAEGAADLEAATCGDLPTVGDLEVSVGTKLADLGPAAPRVSYEVEVAAFTRELRIALNGHDRGLDVDLAVRYAVAPTDEASADCWLDGPSSNVTCRFADPAPGPWHILVSAKEGGAGAAQTTATMFAGAPPEDGDGDGVDGDGVDGDGVDGDGDGDDGDGSVANDGVDEEGVVGGCSASGAPSAPWIAALAWLGLAFRPARRRRPVR